MADAGALIVYREDKVWDSDSGEFELHRHVRIHAEQGSFVSVERYSEEDGWDGSPQRAIIDYMDIDERHFYNMSRAYLESMGFTVSMCEAN